MGLTKKEIKAIADFKSRLGDRFSIIDFRIFGSKSRGDDTQASDMDVMVELEELNPEIQSEIYDIAYEVNLQNNCFISVIIFTRSELETGPLSESPIYKNIMREGIVF